MKCPACEHKEYRLSHSRNFLEKAAAVLGIGPVRCLRCQRRRLTFVLLHGLFS